MDGRRRQICPHGWGLFAARNKYPGRRLTDSGYGMALFGVLILTGIFILGAQSARCENTCVFGTVQSVDPESGIFMLKVDHPARGYDAGQVIEVQADAKDMPEGLSPGETVRVRLEEPMTPDGLPRALRIISPSRFSCGHDRTGVRERLMKGLSPQGHGQEGACERGFGRRGGGHGGRHGR